AIKVQLLVREARQLSMLVDNLSYIREMANVSEITAGQELARVPQAVSAITAAAEIYVPLEGIIDVDKELVRLNKELQSTLKDIEKSEAKLNNEQFLSRAPQEVISKEKAKVEEGNIKKEGIIKRLQILQS
ncbi:MAG: valine--tRNA ligase, partial [Syntrophomonadaceae bacterium]|nr:valine--tRNA ligase [Syntrophomonadaceae bacterium]